MTRNRNMERIVLSALITCALFASLGCQKNSDSPQASAAETPADETPAEAPSDIETELTPVEQVLRLIDLGRYDQAVELNAKLKLGASAYNEGLDRMLSKEVGNWEATNFLMDRAEAASCALPNVKAKAIKAALNYYFLKYPMNKAAEESTAAKSIVVLEAAPQKMQASYRTFIMNIIKFREGGCDALLTLEHYQQVSQASAHMLLTPVMGQMVSQKLLELEVGLLETIYTTQSDFNLVRLATIQLAAGSLNISEAIALLSRPEVKLTTIVEFHRNFRPLKQKDAYEGFILANKIYATNLESMKKTILLDIVVSNSKANKMQFSDEQIAKIEMMK